MHSMSAEHAKLVSTMVELSTIQINEFQTKGYTILSNALSAEQLEALHEEADLLTNHLLSEGIDLVQDLGCIIEPSNCGYLDPAESNDYKTDRDAYRQRRDDILSSNISTITLNTIALWASVLLHSDDEHRRKETYLLNEQYIIKPPSTCAQSSFAWHRDSDYYHDADLRAEPTIACWTALNPVNERNGTIRIQSMDPSDKDEHIVSAEAGSIVFMSSRLLHKSTGNNSQLFRRVFMPQYSKRPLNKDLECFAVPCFYNPGSPSLSKTYDTNLEGE